MRVRSAIVATAVLAVALPLAAHVGTAHAGESFSIAVPDPEVKLKETFTVNGTNACANSPYTVTFAYTNHNGSPGSLQESGTTNGEGQFSEVITVPEAATPDQPANVQATVDCTAPTQTPTPTPDSAPQPRSEALPHAPRLGGGTTSNTVAITIQVATGVLSTDKTQGRAGTVVHVSGTNCLGDDVVVVFGNSGGADDVTVTLLPDDTFSGNYTIPNVPPGSYFFAAACPGTDYEDVAFTVLVTPGASPTALPPAVPGQVDFTG